MSNPAPTLNQINAFNATQGTTIDFNIIGGTEVIRSNKIYIYDLSDNSLICTHLYVSTESIHELPPNTSSSIVYASGKSSADFTNNTQYYAQIQTFTDVGGTQGGSGLSIAKLFWCLPTPTLTLSTIPTTISTTSYNVSATYTPNTSGGATNEIQEFQFNLYSAIGALLQTSGVVLYGEGVDLSYNFSGLEVDSTYYVTLDVTTTQGMNVSAQSNTFTVSIDTPTMGSASVVNNGCDGYISVTSNLSSEYEHEESVEAGEIMSFTTDSVNDITELDVDFEPVQDGTPWMSAQDTEPYMFRPVPTQTEDFGHESDCIVGGTVGANQLYDKSGNYTSNGITYTNTNGKITLSGEASANSWYTLDTSALPQNHKYLVCGGNSNSVYQSNAWLYFIPTVGTYIHLVGGKTASIQQGCLSISIQAYTGYNANTNPLEFVPQIVDLTAYFGSATIADYVYTLEQGTAGAGVAWLKKYAPQLFEYHAYDAGSLVSVSGLTSHDMVGFNQWDEEWELGAIGSSSGDNIVDSNNIRSKNYIPVLPNTSYYFKSPAPIIVWAYDSNKSALERLRFGGGNVVLTMPKNAAYVRFCTYDGSYGTTYNHDICINLSDASLNGTYKPYVKHSYPLDSTLTLRGVAKLDNGNLYYDGDTYESDGTVTRKYGIVDLGTLNWMNGGNMQMFFSVEINNLIRKVSSNNDTPNWIISDKFLPISYNSLTYSTVGRICVSATGSIGIVDGNTYNTLAAFKTAMNGVYLVYELATPTTESADPYTNPQIVDPHGTEQYVGSPIPVGHETTYQRICPISGWDSVSVDVVGKNLFDIGELAALGTAVVGITNGYRFSVTNVMYNTGVSLPMIFENPVTISMDVANISGTNLRMRVINTDGTENEPVGSGTGSGGHVEYTTIKPIKGIKFNWSTAGTFEVTNFQMEFGSTATPYTPYNGQTYTSTFPKYKQQVSQDKTPYITKNIGDTYADTLTENLVGGTVAWNQLVEHGNFDATSGWSGGTVSGNVLTITGTTDGTLNLTLSRAMNIPSGHKTLVMCDVYCGSANIARTRYPFISLSTVSVSADTWTSFGQIGISDTSARVGIQMNGINGETYKYRNFVCFDLTAMFGSTIADYIYSLEQATTGAGVAWFRKLFPSNYYDYNSGTLISVNASAHVIKNANGNVLHTYPLDSDLVLRGIPKLDANNKLYYDGDVYEPSGSVTRKYGIVDLGTLKWAIGGLPSSQSGVRKRMRTTALETLAKHAASNNTQGNIICSIYSAISYNGGYADVDILNRIAIDTDGDVSVFVAYNDYETAADFKSAMNGVYLVYELATQTTEQADPFEENQAIVSNGIEEYTVTEQGDVEMPVGHDSTYYTTGVYGGTINMASGVLTITQRCTDLGALAWQQGANNIFNAEISDKKDVTVVADRLKGLRCSIYPFSTVVSIGANMDNHSMINASTRIFIRNTDYSTASAFKSAMKGVQLVYELETPIEISLTPQQMQTLSGQNNIWSNTNGGMYLVYQLPITSLLVKRRDVADVSGKWLTLYSTPITQASDMDFTFIDFLNQYGKTYQYALVPVLAQDQSGVVVQIEGGYTVSNNVDSIFDGVYIADQTNVERVKAGVGYGNIDMNQGVGSITPIGSKYPIVITNSQNQYHNGSVRGTIVPNDFYSNGNLSRIDMVNKRDELEQFLTNKRAKIIKDWNGKMWLVMIMSNVACSFDDNYGMGMVSFSADWLEVGDPTNQQDLYNAGLINVGGV